LFQAFSGASLISKHS
jgi:hypothetical protein